MRLITAIVVLAAGCTPLRPLDEPEDTGAGRQDAGSPLDAARDDGGSARDASTDAPAPLGTDAAMPDAWTSMERDAWAVDAWAPDAATLDAGSPVRPSALGDVVLSELMIDPGLTFPLGDAEEWLEIHNPSRVQAYDLTGCTLDGMSSMFTIGTVVVPPGGHVVLAQGPKAGLDPDWVYPGAYALRDTTDRVAITCGGVSIDVVMYDARLFGVVEGRSIQVLPAVLGGPRPALDNDDRDAWCPATDTTTYAMGLYGTPGEPNDCGAP